MKIASNVQNVLNKYKGIYPTPLVSMAKDLGIKIYETYDLKDNQAGLIRKEKDNYVIYLNIHDSSRRKRFTIAHEIGHFILHKDILEKRELIDDIRQPILNRNTDKSQKEKQQIEIEANIFAANILMPEKEFKKKFNQSNSVEEVAKYFSVSTAAAAIRAKDLLGLTII